MMRVVHVTQGYAPAIGGTELVMQRVSEELVHRWHADVTVYTTNCYSGEAFFDPAAPRMAVGDSVINGVRVRRFPVESGWGRRFRHLQAPAYRLRLPGNQYLRAYASGPIVRGWTRALRDAPGDLIAASSFPLLHMFQAKAAAEASRRPIVLIGGLHPDDDWGFGRPMIYRAIRGAVYIAYSSFEADHVVARGANPARVFTVGAGVDPEPFESVDQASARAELSLPLHVPIVGYIGQLGGHKGVDILIRSMLGVWRRAPDTHLLIAGARSQFVPVIEAAVASLPAARRAQVHLRYDFPQADKPRLFGAIDVFAYPSGYESFGIAFVEAWAAGKPVIGCLRGAVPTIVSHGIDGLLVPWQAIDALADAIVTLVEDPALASRMGRAGHGKMRRRYTWRHVGERFHEVYRIAIGT